MRESRVVDVAAAVPLTATSCWGRAKKESMELRRHCSDIRVCRSSRSVRYLSQQEYVGFKDVALKPVTTGRVR